jgi:long-chain fatty acid transport protein
MKNSLKIAVASALALCSTSIYATNGVNLIGVGAHSRAMGGVGIGMSFGAESALPNPALISTINGTDISFGGTLFMPKVSTDGGAESVAGALPPVPTGMEDSAADTFIVPEVGFAMKATDNFYWGIGMWGASGLGVDYRDATNPLTGNMVTNYQSLQLVVPLTYKSGGFSMGVAPVLNYGALDTQWTDAGGANGAGASQDLSWGANLGLAYQTGGITVGGVYKSSIKMEYKDQPALNSAILNNYLITGVTDWRLDVPAEYGVGGSYAFGKHTLAMDIKTIKYGDTKGWQDFGWKNQNVIALGYQYAVDKWALRAGYNYGKAPVENLSDFVNEPGNASRNYFNGVGFPATVEHHLTFGGSYRFTRNMALDLAFTFAPKKSTELNSVADTDFNGAPDTPSVVKTDHSQTALTAGMHFSF